MLFCILVYFVDNSKVDSQITKWKTEETFGDDYGRDGYFCISQGGFEKYFFEVVVPKSVLSPEHLALLESSPQEI